MAAASSIIGLIFLPYSGQLSAAIVAVRIDGLQVLIGVRMFRTTSTCICRLRPWHNCKVNLVGNLPCFLKHNVLFIRPFLNFIHTLMISADVLHIF